MLNGIGGRTVAEAKESMTYEEAAAWQQYMHKHGRLSIHERLERGFAMLCTVVNHAVGGKAKMETFMPYTRREEEVASIDAVFGMLKAIKKK